GREPAARSPARRAVGRQLARGRPNPRAYRLRAQWPRRRHLARRAQSPPRAVRCRPRRRDGRGLGDRIGPAQRGGDRPGRPCGLSRDGGAVRRAFAVAGALALTLVLASCGGSGKRNATLVVAVDAPFSRSPYIGETIAHGVELAASEVNAQSGISTKDTTYTVKVKRYDNAL